MNTEIINKYNNLSDIEKTMVQILGVNVCALRQNDLLEILNMSGLYDTNGNTLNIQKFRLLLNGLINKNLVEKQAEGVSCNELLIDFAFKEALDCGKFSEISDLIVEKSPLEKTDSGFYDFSFYKECIKAIQAGFSEKKDEIYFEAVYLSAIEKFSSMPFFYNFFVKQFQKKLLDKLSSKKRAVVIKNIFYDCLLFLLPPFSLIDYLKELLSVDPDFEYKYFFLENFLLWGRFADAESLAAIDGECSSFELCRFFAIYYSFKGDCEKAVLFFKKSLDFLEKKDGTKKSFYKGLTGIFFILNLLGSKDLKNQKFGLEYIDIVKKYEPKLYNLFQYLIPFFNENLGITAKEINLPLFFLSLREYVFSFFFILFSSWHDIESAKKHIPFLIDLAKEANKCGLKWLEAESLALLGNLGSNKKANLRASLKIHMEYGTKTITNLINTKTDWEKNLKALINIGKSEKFYKSQESSGNLERLIWSLSYNEKMNSVSVSPFIQKFSKNKTWTKGRAVPLKNLHDNFLKMEYLAEKDKQVCTLIEENYFYGGYYNSREYFLSPKKAIQILAGHEHVYFGDDRTNPLDIVKAEP